MLTISFFNDSVTRSYVFALVISYVVQDNKLCLAVYREWKSALAFKMLIISIVLILTYIIVLYIHWLHFKFSFCITHVMTLKSWVHELCKYCIWVNVVCWFLCWNYFVIELCIGKANIKLPYSKITEYSMASLLIICLMTLYWSILHHTEKQNTCY